MPIISSKGPPEGPRVTVSSSGAQLRVGFNAKLANACRMALYDYVHVDVDDDRRGVTFLFGKQKELANGDRGYRLGFDGGAGAEKKTAARATYVSATLFDMLTPGQYRTTVGRKNGNPAVRIECRPDLLSAQRLDSVDGIPTRTKGVYALFDRAGNVVDYGQSGSDVRARVRDQWGAHVASVSFVRLGSAKEARHWERFFHTEHKRRFGTLPKGNPVVAPGCGCDECER